MWYLISPRSNPDSSFRIRYQLAAHICFQSPHLLWSEMRTSSHASLLIIVFTSDKFHNDKRRFQFVLAFFIRLIIFMDLMYLWTWDPMSQVAPCRYISVWLWMSVKHQVESTDVSWEFCGYYVHRLRRKQFCLIQTKLSASLKHSYLAHLCVATFHRNKRSGCYPPSPFHRFGWRSLDIPNAELCEGWDLKNLFTNV